MSSSQNDCLVFFEECVRNKVICVPGVFFDVNPGGIRHIKKSMCINHVRFSYGPPIENLYSGMKNIKKVIDRWSSSIESQGRRRTTALDDIEVKQNCATLRRDTMFGQSARF